MAIINLRKYYYPTYTKDTFIEVPDDVAAVLEEERRIKIGSTTRKVTITSTLWTAPPASRITPCSLCCPRKN